MKQKFLILISAFLFSMVVMNFANAAINTFGSDSCSPNIQILNQDPNPAVPNEYVKVIFEVSNLANCNGFAVKLNPKYPFSLDPNYDAIQSIADSPYTPGYKAAWDVPYKIRIAEDVLDGDYKLDLIYHEGSNKNFDSTAIYQGFNISVVDVQTDFAVVVQDSSSSQVSLGIVNIGKNTANSLIVNIPMQENYRASGTSEQIVGNLAAGDYTLVTFNVASIVSRNGTRPNFRPGNFSAGNAGANENNLQMLQVKLDYTDGVGKRRSITKEIQFTSLAFGNQTRTGSGFNRTTSSSSLTTTDYIIIIVVILIIIFLIYKGYHKKIFVKIKNSKDKKFSENNSGNEPEWVSAERKKNKK